jgi:hypothetical protein
MNIKAFIKYLLFKNNISIEKLNSKDDLDFFLSRFREKYVSCDLIRIGADRDGGYLHPDLLNNISYCFSPGVGMKVDFEKFLSDKYNIKTFMADGSVKNLPLKDKNFNFISKFLGSYNKNNYLTLSEWINESLDFVKDNMILQMDIDGSEYDVLTYEDSNTFAKFQTMIIEFHNLHKMFESDFLRIVTSIFEKIYKNFSICHVHPNNCSRIHTLYGLSVPPVIEVTFIRNDMLKKYVNKKPILLPHELDIRNSINNKDILMPEVWWKKY